MGKPVVAACPDCGSEHVTPAVSRPGLFECQDCKAPLVRLTRRGNSVVGGGSVVYVNPARSGPQVEGAPRPTDNGGVIDVD